MDVPNYKPSLGSYGNWYVDGPGEGLNYHTVHLYRGLCCLSREHATAVIPVAIKAYKFGYRQFQLQMQLALGLPVDSGQLVNHGEFTLKPYQMCEPTDNNLKWIVRSECRVINYESILFDTSEEARVAGNVGWSTYRAGYGAARIGICKLINAKINGV